MANPSPNPPTPHETLDISLTATPTEIKAAYRKLILSHHPDKNPGSKQDLAEEKFKDIQRAYEILTDPDKAAEYERELKAAKKDAERELRAREKAVREERARERAEKTREWETRRAREEKSREEEESRRKRREVETNTRLNKGIGRVGREEAEREQEPRIKRAPSRKTRQANVRPEATRAQGGRDGDSEEDESDGEQPVYDDVHRNEAGKKKVQFAKGSTPPTPLRPRRASKSTPEPVHKRHRRTSDREVPVRPATPGFKANGRHHQVRVFHHVHHDNGDHHHNLYRKPSHKHLPTKHRDPTTPLSPTSPPPACPRADPPPNNTAETKTLTAASLRASTTLTTTLTALSTFLSASLSYTHTSPRLTLVTQALNDLTHLHTRLTALQSRTDEAMAHQASDEAQHRGPDAELRRRTARAVEEVGRYERVLVGQAERVCRVVREAVPGSVRLRMDGMDEEVVAVVRGRERMEDVEREWTAERRARVWGVVEAFRREVDRLLPPRRV